MVLVFAENVCTGGAAGAHMEVASMMKEPGQIRTIKRMRISLQEPDGATGTNRESRRTGAAEESAIRCSIAENL